MNKLTYTTFALLDPVDGAVIYIGTTMQSLAKRLTDLRNGANCAVSGISKTKLGEWLRTQTIETLVVKVLGTTHDRAEAGDIAQAAFDAMPDTSRLLASRGGRLAKVNAVVDGKPLSTKTRTSYSNIAGRKPAL